MSAFTDLDDWRARLGPRYVVTRPLQWELGHLGSGHAFEVPVGFRFEVSVPRWARWALDPHHEPFLKPAALHDAMVNRGWDRRRAGAEFALALEACGVGRVTVFAMWLAVSAYRWA